MRLSFFITIWIATTTVVNAQPYQMTYFTSPYAELTSPTVVSGSDAWYAETYKVPLAFPFTFVSQIFDSVTISTYGYLDFSGDTIRFSGLWGNYRDRNYIATGSLSPISYQVSGTVGNRIQKFQFKNLGFYMDFLSVTPSNHMNFQIWLFEADNSLETHVGPNECDSWIDCFSGIGPIVGIASTNQAMNDIHYSLFATGIPSAPSTGTMTSMVDIPRLEGPPPNEMVYRFGSGSNSVEQTTVAGALEIYPIPTGDFLHLKWQGGEAKIKVVDFAGRLVYETQQIHDGEILSIKSLPNGFYTLILQRGDGVEAKKFVVQH